MPKTLTVLLISFITLSACSETEITQLERIQAADTLKVVTRNGPTTYYLGPDGPAGFEYELATRFAEYLGVKLEIILPKQPGDILPMIVNGRADVAAAGLAVTELRSRDIAFGPAYQYVTQQLIYRRGETKPESLADLAGNIAVVDGSSQAEWLLARTAEMPGNMDVIVRNNKSQQQLLAAVAAGDYNYTIVSSDVFAANQRLFPELAMALEITEPLAVAWAFDGHADSNNPDRSLLNAANVFFTRLKKSGELQQLQERHLGPDDLYDYVNARHFLEQTANRLPRLLPDFYAAAKQHGFDWRLLAAMGYQESHWDPDARSPTGVRGVMMLTQNTAEHVGVTDRTDAAQSIAGGARYLREMVEKVPARIPEPDRLWLALASYNVGYAHLEDARMLTESNGGDPDKWEDVSKHLPLLNQEQWYKQTRYGYANGYQAQHFVENIRRYFNTLVWLYQRKLPPGIKPPQIQSPIL